MKRIAALFLLALLALATGACATRPTRSPSTATVVENASRAATRIGAAQAAATSGKGRVATATVSTSAARARAAQVNDAAAAARAAIATKNYEEADRQLVQLREWNTAAIAQLEATARDLEEARKAFDQVNLELTAANGEIDALKANAGTLQREIDRLSTQAAADHAIAKRVNSWFGLGAIFYGVERLLHAGIIGFLLFAAVIIALMACGVPAWGFLVSLFGRFKT